MKIKLHNRDGADLYLVSEDEKVWEFEVDKNHKYVLKYIRMGFKEDNKTIDFIDPSGGPFISIGSIIEGNKVIALIEQFDKILIATEKV